MAKYSDVPVEYTGGFSTYIRHRFYLDRYPNDREVRYLYMAAESWLKACENGEYFGKAQKILSFQLFVKYSRPVFEVKYDVAIADPRVTSCLNDKVKERLAYEGMDIGINKIQVAYYNIDD